MLQPAQPSHVPLNTNFKYCLCNERAENQEIMENEIYLISLIWHIAPSQQVLFLFVCQQNILGIALMVRAGILKII